MSTTLEDAKLNEIGKGGIGGIDVDDLIDCSFKYSFEPLKKVRQ